MTDTNSPVGEVDLAGMRRDYGSTELTETDLAADWPTQFGRWLADAVAADIPEPNAMVLATADAAGRPSARTVLCRGADENGLVFFSGSSSRKGSEIAANPYASLVFPWFAIRRQVTVCGEVTLVDEQRAAEYWASRPRESQWGAWASPQSQPIADRAGLERRLAEAMRRFPRGTAVPPAPDWAGYLVVPQTVEFWQGRTGRLHDRLQYRRVDDGWCVERLGP